MTNHHILKITETGAALAEQHIEAESVILAVGMSLVQKIPVETLEEKVLEVYAIGDCVISRHVLSAIWEGFRKARLT